MPAWLLPLILGLGAAGSTAASMYSANKARQSSDAQAEADRELQEAIAAVRESELDPFRNQLHQAGAVNSLDMLERSTYTPVQVQGPAGLDPKFIPRFSGGTSYTKSPEAIRAYGALKNSVLAGQSAPAVLDRNQNNPNALDLLSLINGTAEQAGWAPRTARVGSRNVAVRRRDAKYGPFDEEDDPYGIGNRRPE